MALTRCRECKNEVSSDTTTCPKCGLANPAQAVRKPKPRWLIWVGILFVASFYFTGRAMLMPDTSPSATSLSTSGAASLEPLPEDPANPRPYFLTYEAQTVPKERIAITVNLVYSKAPASSAIYADLVRELTRYVNDNRNPKVGDIGGYAFIGDRRNPKTWKQIKDPQNGYIFAWYDWSIHSIVKGMGDPTVVLAQVNAVIPGPPQPTLAERQANQIKATVLGIRFLKSQMRNPASFELISAAISDSGERCVEYRAQNGFGGVNVEHAVLGSAFKTSSEATFSADWNKKCANRPLTDLTDRVKLQLGE